MFIRKALKKINRLLDKPSFATDDVVLGKGVTFGRNVVFNCKKIRIGDGCTFKDNVKIDATEFEIADYGTIYQNCFFPGPGNLKIGHNFWLGNDSIIDSQGNTSIGNNVGIGAQSQLWGHMSYGDVMYGCRFDSVKGLELGNDVWLVGHNLVSPVKIADRSMALLGSLITKDMEADKTYGGTPAIDITSKIGSQFKISTLEERAAYFEKSIELFCKAKKINRSDFFNIIKEKNAPLIEEKTNFILSDRTYTKRGTALEMELMKHLLPKIKFVPLES